MPAKPPAPLSLPAFIVLLMITLGVACYYRLPSLEERPMHTDEAILAVKTAQFQATGHFEYDKHDFHGPGLHYATWLWSRVAGWGGLESWTDTQVRTVSVVCGLLLLLVTLLVRDALGRTGTVCAMLLMAVSPMQVFYSRYYIMEMLLVLLIAISGASLWRYTQSGKRSWLMLAGLSLGLQHATKETFILNLAAGFVAWASSPHGVADSRSDLRRVVRTSRGSGCWCPPCWPVWRRFPADSATGRPCVTAC
jgi:uncharacterized protein (TIGR03663 family)